LSDTTGWGAGDKAGELVDGATGKFDELTAEDLAKADALLKGKERAPIDIEKFEAEFVRGVDLSTPDGDVPTAAVAPNDPSAQNPKSSVLSSGKRIEIIHFGKVHRDWARNFDHKQPFDDMKLVDLAGVVGSRAVGFRAALQREAVLLAGFARATQAALEAKDQGEGATDDLLTAAADLLGGASGTAQSAVAADLTPFLDKIDKQIWNLLNRPLIRYADLHTAGIKLHEVRVNLRVYVRQQLEAIKNPPKEEKGLLSDLPLIGEIPIPGELGEVIGLLQKVTGKLHDIQIGLIFHLLDAMQLPIEKACLAVSLDQLRGKTAPIYPAWFPPPEAEEGEEAPFANYQQDDVIGGDLAAIDPLADVNEAVQDGVGAANDVVNTAVEKPMEVIDFLSKEVPPAPGNKHLADIFGAQTDPDGPFFGCEMLGKVCVASFGQAIGAGTVPTFMRGFVGDFVAQVFAVCAEFVRGVYGKLCSLEPAAVISTEELIKAARDHIVFKLIDVVLEKTTLDGLLDELKFTIPGPPPLPSGFNWPTGKELSLKPIIAMLKAEVSDGLAEVIDPVLEYAMAGMAERLNSQRAWAGPKAMTMEAHLAQLPGELALMFRNLFGPVWGFFSDTLMGALNNAMGEVLGPAAGAVGMVQDGFADVTNTIADVKNKASQAVAYAKNVEGKAKDLIDKLSSMEVALDDWSDIDEVNDAVNALSDAAGADPFSDAATNPAGGGGAGGAPFPQNRVKVGIGAKIDRAEQGKVEPDLKWKEARVEGGEEKKDDAARKEEDK
jgi:hypothetical protein